MIIYTCIYVYAKPKQLKDLLVITVFAFVARLRTFAMNRWSDGHFQGVFGVTMKACKGTDHANVPMASRDCS